MASEFGLRRLKRRLGAPFGKLNKKEKEEKLKKAKKTADEQERKEKKNKEPVKEEQK